MAISRVSLISVPVSNPGRSKAFYEDVLGFDVLADSEFGPGQRWIQLAPHGAQTSISLVTWLEDFAPGSLRGLLVEVDDLDQAIAELGSRGLTITGDIDDTPWGRFAPFADPDGNRWSLHEPSAEMRG
jgi:predicted enzyme related to lactoylglutathione lyase